MKMKETIGFNIIYTSQTVEQEGFIGIKRRFGIQKHGDCKKKQTPVPLGQPQTEKQNTKTKTFYPETVTKIKNL